MNRKNPLHNLLLALNPYFRRNAGHLRLSSKKFVDWYQPHLLLALSLLYQDFCKGGTAMECAKCQGLMIEESFSDGAGYIHEWRCVNCGAILDAVIAQNQMRRSSACRPAVAFPD